MLNYAPAIRRKRNNGDLAASDVLLIFERQIAGQENLVSGVLRCFEQLAILESAESDIHRRGHIVVWQMGAQLMGQVLVGKNSHGWSIGL
jgi:hypothetical protein